MFGNLGRELLGGLMPALPRRRTHWAFLEAIHIPVTYKIMC